MVAPQRRVAFAWALLVLSLVGWPLSALTLAKDEPPFVLALSWLAISLTALDVVFTADVRREQDADTEEIARICQHCGHPIAARASATTP